MIKLLEYKINNLAIIYNEAIYDDLDDIIDD